ncbi:MAG: CPBP family intramembrane metalloprotease [Ruminococcaceae bacterium]|nr:CPBP family intramembrane metalloprotease [Oscillospiraceae bacterium]
MNEPNQTADRESLRGEYARQILSVCAGIASIVLFTTVAQLLLIELIKAYAPSLFARGWFLVVLSSVPMYLVAMPLSLFFFRAGKPLPPRVGGKLSVLAFLGLLVICFSITVVGNLVSNFIQTVISKFTGDPVVNEVGVMTMNTPFWANLLFMGILAPILEEIFYRKLVIDRLRVFGDLPAVLLSGVLFGLIHGTVSQVFYAILFGILVGLVYVYTGKLRYGIALHLSLNLLGGVLSTEIVRGLNAKGLGELDGGQLYAHLADYPLQVVPYLLYNLFMWACIIATPVALALLWKYTRLPKSPSQPSKKCIARAFLTNPAAWILALVIILLFCA